MKRKAIRTKLILLAILLGLLCIAFLPNYLTQSKTKKVMSEYYASARWNKLKSEYENLPIKENSTLYYGNSMTENFKPFQTDSSILNFGISGDFSIGLIHRIHSVIRQQPARLFIMIGINDIIENVPIDQVYSNYETILTSIIGNCPKTELFIQSTLPTRDLNSTFTSSYSINKKVMLLNQKLKTLCKEMNLTFVDLYPYFSDEDNLLKRQLTTDGIHLTEEGYTLWSKQINKFY